MSKQSVDPLLKEDESYHSRGRLPAYLERLRSSRRAYLAEKLTEQKQR